jgi:hypothetical protein
MGKNEVRAVNTGKDNMSMICSLQIEPQNR